MLLVHESNRSKGNTGTTNVRKERKEPVQKKLWSRILEITTDYNSL